MKKIIAFLTAVMMTVTVCVSAQYSESDLVKTVDSAVSWKNSKASPYYNSGTEASDLYIFALKRLGVEYDYERYGDNMKSVLGGYGSNRAASVYARTILALTACGENASDYNGRDFIADGTYNKNNINGADEWSWALIALDSRKWELPDWAPHTRADMIKNIMAEQDTNGSIGGSAYSTALSLIALAEYTYDETAYEYTNNVTGERKYATAWEIASPAIDYLASEQSDWGDYYNLKTTALSLIALDYMDIDAENDERFIKGGKSVVDGLMEYAVGDGSFSSDMNDSDSTATTYAICALTSHLRQLQGKSKLFDLTANDTVDGVKNNLNGSSATSPSSPTSTKAPTVTKKPSTSSGSSSTKKPTTTKVPSTKRPATTMSPTSSAKPSVTKAPKKALVGPVKMPGPMPQTPEPLEESETLNTPQSGRGVSHKLPMGIAMLAMAALITAALVTYVIRTSKDVPLPKRKTDTYRAKTHRRTETHGAYKKRGKYKERGKYKGSRRK